jgi:hypothetical protein
MFNSLPVGRAISPAAAFQACSTIPQRRQTDALSTVRAHVGRQSRERGRLRLSILKLSGSGCWIARNKVNGKTAKNSPRTVTLEQFVKQVSEEN